MSIERIETRPASLEVLADIAYSTRFTASEQSLNIESYERTKALLVDVGLDPDRKYTVAEITAIRDGITFVMGLLT